ncbi:hypothetical protein [Cesiribacter andamanensis]|uniref:GLPGLI family protein n=1 Tax=Cesiribacter andamanensis AMV16 TaxID=1279009 RepID=M7N475_9BACT|nr:hypothetical protein [Cesiribacter andamanensis]EMR02016.1 hypothetical protein ADICEAN_02840 [Cesiribacter andamanensis AMV16]
MRVVFLLVFLIFSCFGAFGQQPSYGAATVSLMDQADDRSLEVRYDSFFDKLYYAVAEGEEGEFLPSQVSEFTTGGARYYSIPMAGGQPAFFKVLYEGASYAVLQKDLSASLIQYLCSEYPASFWAEADEQSGRLRLYYRSGNSLIADMAEELELESATFVATPSGLCLFQLHTPGTLTSDELDAAKAAEPGLQMISLKKLFSSQQQFAQAKKIIRGNKLQLDSPTTIADAFRQIEAQL